MPSYCEILAGIGNALTAIGNGSHWIYVKCGEGLYWVATMGGAAGCPK